MIDTEIGVEIPILFVWKFSIMHHLDLKLTF